MGHQINRWRCDAPSLPGPGAADPTVAGVPLSQTCAASLIRPRPELFARRCSWY